MSEVLKDIINALRNGTVPAEGTEYIAVGIDDELKEIESQLEYVRKDKSDLFPNEEVLKMLNRLAKEFYKP